jgi:hypothetical protein
MFKIATVAAALALLSVVSAKAEDAKPPEVHNGLMPQSQAHAPERPAETKLDLSRSVTITGAEIDAIVKAQVFSARAKDAQDAVAPVLERLRSDMTVKDEKK